MFVKIGRLINLYFIIIIVMHKNANKKHYINVFFNYLRPEGKFGKFMISPYRTLNLRAVTSLIK